MGIQDTKEYGHIRNAVLRFLVSLYIVNQSFLPSSILECTSILPILEDVIHVYRFYYILAAEALRAD
jgi:hypothetical protein